MNEKQFDDRYQYEAHSGYPLSTFSILIISLPHNDLSELLPSHSAYNLYLLPLPPIFFL